MSIQQRSYRPEPLFGEDYARIRRFLIRLDDCNYHFGRWDWMITHVQLDKQGLHRIGLWEEDDELVALATYDSSLGKAFLLALPGYESLKEEMLLYAQQNLHADSHFSVLIQDEDRAMQEIAVRHGFYASQDRELDSVLPLADAHLSYTLPEGFRITSMDKEYDLYKYGQVLWKGFNHELRGEGPYRASDKDLAERDLSFHRPNVNLSLKVAVVAPNGDFVSYCGMWLDEASPSALVEPVATDPDYRKMGLGKAAVLEAVRRCRELGATRAFVGSEQQFYYSIGFRPYASATYWHQKLANEAQR